MLAGDKDSTYVPWVWCGVSRWEDYFIDVDVFQLIFIGVCSLVVSN